MKKPVSVGKAIGVFGVMWEGWNIV